mmetsp:Transcript_58020/g.138109  ORF Transcript_58020/g.138109 Transcript_58020/m.138109 type:complete len:302 (+) Transcript_58020:92-997(+)
MIRWLHWWYAASVLAHCLCGSVALEIRHSGRAAEALNWEGIFGVDANGSPVTKEDAICRIRNSLALKHVQSITQPELDLLSALSRKGLMGSSCALVSNSGMLSKFELGSKIDSADLVMRFNEAPLHGYETHVGARDDIRFVNMHWGPNVLMNNTFPSKDVIYINVLAAGFDVYWRRLGERRPDLQVFQVQLWQLDTLTETLRDIYGVQAFKGHISLPTSGAVGMALALSMCGHLEAYGMARAWTEDEESTPYHYYEPGGSARGNDHHQTFYAEKGLWRFMADDTTLVDNSSTAVITSPTQC